MAYNARRLEATRWSMTLQVGEDTLARSVELVAIHWAKGRPSLSHLERVYLDPPMAVYDEWSAAEALQTAAFLYLRG